MCPVRTHRCSGCGLSGGAICPYAVHTRLVPAGAHHLRTRLHSASSALRRIDGRYASGHPFTQITTVSRIKYRITSIVQYKQSFSSSNSAPFFSFRKRSISPSHPVRDARWCAIYTVPDLLIVTFFLGEPDAEPSASISETSFEPSTTSPAKINHRIVSSRSISVIRHRRLDINNALSPRCAPRAYHSP